MPQLRVGSHHLNIETLRGKIKDPSLRTCTLCQNTEPEDEFHLLMSCTTIQQGRAKLFSEIIKRTPNFIRLNNECRFQWILSNEDKDINKLTAEFIEQSFSKRREMAYPQ